MNKKSERNWLMVQKIIVLNQMLGKTDESVSTLELLKSSNDFTTDISSLIFRRIYILSLTQDKTEKEHID